MPARRENGTRLMPTSADHFDYLDYGEDEQLETDPLTD